MPKIRIPFADTQHNRSYLNDKDYLLLNAFIERNSQGADIIKRPCWKKKLTVSSIVSSARGFTYSDSHALYYCVIGDALFKIDNALTTVTEIIRKTPTSASYSAADGGTLTYVFAAAHGFVVAQQIKISGITGATLSEGYIGVKTIAAITTTVVANDTFTVTGVGADPGAATLTNARVSPILTETGKVYFEQTKNGAALVTMLMVPKSASYGSQLFMIEDGGSASRVTDADLPTDCVGKPVSFDGYLFVLSEAESGIHNSDLEAPSSFNSLGFVNAEKFADSPVTLAKHFNNLVCFKQYSTEFFYDAALAAPASPLSNVPQQTVSIGCASAASVVETGNNIIYMSRNQNGGIGVHIMSGGVPQKVSTPYIDKILASMESFVFGEKVESFHVSFEGHDFYALSIEGLQGANQAIAGIAVAGLAITGLNSGLNTFKRTLVYDMTEQHWHEWSSYDPVTLQQSVFFGAYTVSGAHISNPADYTNALLMEKSTGDIYEMSPPPASAPYAATYKDGTRTVTVKIVTNPLDGGTRNRKRCSSFEVIGDKATTATNISVRYSDDDYVTWSTTRNIDMNGVRPRLINLGAFRRRAFEIIHADDMPLRISSIELDVEKMGN